MRRWELARFRMWFSALLAVLALGLFGCGNSSGNAGVGAGGSGAHAGAGGVNGAGTAGSTGSTGTGGTGAGGCSIYQAVCGGACVTVASDPNNCGACNNKCMMGQVCVGGGCTGMCLPGAGQTNCAGQCVDTTVDNANCGTCGHACGMNQGCVGGTCAAAKIFTTPTACAGGGPVPTIGTGATAQCAGLIAQTTFTWSVCSCKDVNFTADALVDGWDSTKGPYKAGTLGGGVGANNSIQTMSTADIWGQTWAASTTTAFNTSQIAVHHNLESGGNVTGGDVTVTKDAYVSGNVTSDTMTVGGTFYQSPGKSHPANLSPMQPQMTVTVPPPCNCTSPVPVGDYVTWAKTNNNNAAIGLDAGLMSQAGHPAHVDLPCGVYYLSGFSSGGEIVAHGNVALFIDGSVTSSADLVMTVADASSAFDIYVSGTIVATSSFKLGSPSYPALTRLYVGGTQTLDVQSTLTIGAEIWAGNCTVMWESDSVAYGAIFAGDFQVVSNFTLHYDDSVVQTGKGCPPPEGGTGTGGSGGGRTCMNCRDCGNQACINGVCGGSCSSNADCCAPLVCSNGHCEIPVN